MTGHRHAKTPSLSSTSDVSTNELENLLSNINLNDKEAVPNYPLGADAYYNISYTVQDDDEEEYYVHTVSVPQDNADNATDQEEEEEEEMGASWTIPASTTQPRKKTMVIIDSSTDEKSEEEEDESSSSSSSSSDDQGEDFTIWEEEEEDWTFQEYHVSLPPNLTIDPKSTPKQQRKQPLSTSNITTTPAVFKRQRDQLTKDIFKEYNSTIFNNALPADLVITWNPRLRQTAGLTHYKREVHLVEACQKGSNVDINGISTGEDGTMQQQSSYVYTARIELSSKVLDNREKLEKTLCHELCHCAAWLIDHTAKPPHGAVFQKWAALAKKRGYVEVTTCHNYEIFFKFKWQCTNNDCLQEYGRHSNSLDVNKKVCGRCRGRLQFLGRFKQGLNGEAIPIGGREGKDGGGGSREATGFSLFVKEYYAVEKKNLPSDANAHQFVMKALSQRWNQQKQQTVVEAGDEGNAVEGEVVIDLT